MGRLAVAEPVRPLVPAVGLDVLLGLAVALAEPVLPEALPDMLPVGRSVVVLPLIEPPVPVKPCLTLAT